jgi:1-acyl-sn-glycerol-3-phosphate acyltransferase
MGTTRGIPPGARRRAMVFTASMNLVAPTLIILWTAVSIVIFPLLFIGLSIATGDRPDVIMRKLIWAYGRGWLAIMSPYVDFRRRGFDNPKVSLPGILVMNHLSFFDVFCLGLLPFSNVVMAVRNWPFKMPWYRPFMILARYLNVESMNSKDIVHEADIKLAQGAGILFFPEAHRSRDGRLQRFYTGAFRLAMETQRKIIPVCISGTDVLWPPNRLLLKPAAVELRALDPVDPSGFSGRLAHRALSRHVKQLMAQALGQMDAVS